MVRIREHKDFYMHALRLAVPMMIQNGITTFVSMLDNLMIGQVGTEAMSGVAIANQLITVWYLMVFGALSGVGIFTTQYYGRKEEEGIRNTFRLMLILAVFLVLFGILFFLFTGQSLIGLYLSDRESDAAALTGSLSWTYLQIILLSFLPYAMTQTFSIALRSCSETVIPMQASVLAVLANLVGDYVLIYGKAGAPALGVSGAAIATVLSRFAEFLFLFVRVRLRIGRFPYLQGVFRHFHIPGALVRQCLVRSAPLMANETLWSMSQAALSQSYSLRGLTVVAAYNICLTLSNVFSICFLAMGSAIGILIGQELGSGRTETVQDDALRLTRFSIFLCCLTSALMALVSFVFPDLYNTSAEVRTLARRMILVCALLTPLDAGANGLYFTIRSGGQVLVTMVFDSLFCWSVQVPVSYALVCLTDLPVLAIYAVILSLVALKCVLGYVLVKRGKWIRTLTV
jgi:putative MATE family efflux protein